MILGPQSEPQPDAYLRVLESYGGNSHLIGGYLHGAPELMVEVAVSTRLRDLNDKKIDYERAGVDEYLVVVPERQQVLWFCLTNGSYRLIDPDAQGTLRSRRFPGLWLNPTALLANDMRDLRKTLHAGLASPEHQIWIVKMQQKCGDQEQGNG